MFRSIEARPSPAWTTASNRHFSNVATINNTKHTYNDTFHILSLVSLLKKNSKCCRIIPASRNSHKHYNMI